MLGTFGRLRYLGHISALLLPVSVNLASPFSSSCLSGQICTTVESGPHSTGLWVLEAGVGSITLRQWLDGLICDSPSPPKNS